MRNNKKLNALMPLIVSGVVNIIAEENGQEELNVIQNFYHSDTYSALEEEQTGFWKMSDLALADIYLREKEGHMIFEEILR